MPTKLPKENADIWQAADEIVGCKVTHADGRRGMVVGVVSSQAVTLSPGAVVPQREQVVNLVVKPFGDGSPYPVAPANGDYDGWELGERAC